MSIYVYFVTLCLLVGEHTVSPYGKAPTVNQHPMTDMSENTGHFLERRSTSGVKIAASATVSEGTILRGDITIGPNTVVNSKAVILAESGPIVIGQRNVINTGASIINRAPPGGSSDAGKTQTIGNDNVFNTGSTCYALKIGDRNVFNAETTVGREVVVTNDNVIG